MALVQWALENSSVSGAINATAPDPVTNRDFSRALGRALHRPSWLPIPAFALRLIVGEMADVALVDGQRVLPKRATELGFQFRYSTIDDAMRAAVGVATKAFDVKGEAVKR
jgi:NAD dependent epimerase/dehydratase family enzyme